MNTKIISQLENKTAAASHKLREATGQMWPEGTPVRVMLSRSQIVPSNGIVQSVRPGELCVRLSTMNKRGRYTVKNVHWSRVCA